MEPRIQVSMPVYGGVHPGTMMDLVKLLHRCWTGHGPTDQIYLAVVKNSALPKSRWELLQRARRNMATYLLWLDADMRFPPYLLDFLLDPAAEIVGCNYRMRQGNHEPIVQVGGKPIETSKHGPRRQEVDLLGFGILLTQEAVFDQILRPFDIDQRPDGSWPDDSIAFSTQARAAGYTLWVDHEASLSIGHIGEETWRTVSRRSE